MKPLIVIAAAAALIVGCSDLANARYLLDEYFGVELSVNEATGQFNMPWRTATTPGYMIHEDWRTDGDQHAPDPGPRYYVSEVFDIEAMYLDIDSVSSQVVFSIVTSMPPTGYNQVSWYPGYVFRTGDIRFDIGGNLYVLGTFGSTYGQMYYNPTMTYTDGYRGFAERGNPVLAAGNTAMSVPNLTFSYREYLTANGQPLLEGGEPASSRYRTYVIEGSFSLASMGLSDAKVNSMTLGMSCNNDLATLTTIPEPTTITLLGMGLIGVYGASRRFMRKR